MDGRFDTNYEPMILRSVPDDRPEDRMEHYRGLFCLVDLHSRTMGTFRPGAVFASDFERLFITGRDREMIARWLNRFQDADDLLSGSLTRDTFSLSNEEYQDFLGSYQEDD